MNRGMKRFIQRGFFVILMFSLLMPVQPVLADDIKESQGFRKHVTLAGIREHQAALQSISDDNGGNRRNGYGAAYILAFVPFTFFRSVIRPL